VTLVFDERLSSIARLDVGIGGTLRDAFGGAVVAVSNQAVGANPADTTGPTVTARTWGNGRDKYTVSVQFSEAMDRASVEAVNNYALAGVPPGSVELDATGMVATLVFPTTTSGFRRTDTLTISNGVRDVNGQANTSTNPAGITGNATDTTGPSAPASSRVWGRNQTSYVVDVTFNEVMDKTSAETLTNYLLGGDMPTAAALDPTGRTVRLTFAATTVGFARTDTLTLLATVRDINGRGTVSTAATAITPNPIDTAGPSLSSELGRVWEKNSLTYTVLLTFNEVMDRASATTLTHYTLAGDGGEDVLNPATAALDATGRVVTLTFPATTAGLRRSDRLTVSAEVLDINGRATTSTQAATIQSNSSDTVPPVAVSRTWAGNAAAYQVEVVFSEAMDKLSATTQANYRLHGNGGTDIQLPSSAVLDPTGHIVTLVFGSSLGGFNRLDALEILPGVTDMNGRGTSSITTVGAIVSRNTADTTPPSVVRATVMSRTRVNNQTTSAVVDVLFNEVLNKAAAEAAAFTVSGGLTVDSVALRYDGLTLRLVVGGEPFGETISVPGTISDINNNLLAPVDVTPAELLYVDAGLDINGTIGTTVTFSPAVSGGVGPYVFSWTPTAGLSSPNVMQPEFTPTTVGTFVFTVTVTDAEGRTATDTVQVIVLPS
jgi:hypothetical protein